MSDHILEEVCTLSGVIVAVFITVCAVRASPAYSPPPPPSPLLCCYCSEQERKKEQLKYGVYFDDDYDYLQHLKERRARVEMVAVAPSPLGKVGSEWGGWVV